MTQEKIDNIKKALKYYASGGDEDGDSSTEIAREALTTLQELADEMRGEGVATKTELKNCPFCAGKAEYIKDNGYNGAFIDLKHKKGCAISHHDQGDLYIEDIEQAIKAWNTRVDNAQRYKEALEKYANEEVSMFDDSGEIARNALKNNNK